MSFSLIPKSKKTKNIKEKKMQNKEMWEKTEISTRNCYNAIVQNGGEGTFQRGEFSCYNVVSCRIGGELGNKPLFLYDGDNNKLAYNRVISRGVLFASCKKCADFDNEWD